MPLYISRDWSHGWLLRWVVCCGIDLAIAFTLRKLTKYAARVEDRVAWEELVLRRTPVTPLPHIAPKSTDFTTVVFALYGPPPHALPRFISTQVTLCKRFLHGVCAQVLVSSVLFLHQLCSVHLSPRVFDTCSRNVARNRR